MGIVKNLDAKYIQDLRDRLKVCTSPNHFLDLFIQIENSSLVRGACAETPFFVLTPPTLLRKSLWQKNIKNFKGTSAQLKKLLSDSFMPFDSQIARSKGIADPTRGSQIDFGSEIIDLDYGYLIFTSMGRPAGRLIDLPLLKRYIKMDNSYTLKKERILNIGAERGHIFNSKENTKRLLNENKIPSVDDVIKISVNSRSEIEDTLSKLQSNISVNSTLEIWLRGQPAPYLLENYPLKNWSNLIPHRGRRDYSTVPSLYRNLSQKLSNMVEYVERCIELLEYELFLKNNLLEFKYEENVSVPPLGPEWHNYAAPTSMKQPTASDNKVNYPGFMGLQSSLFMQHYGIDSPILDITDNIDVALFFAQNKILDGTYKKIDRSQDKPVIFIYILRKDYDRFLKSNQLLHSRLLRPTRQDCGILAGASLINRNYYSRYIAICLEIDKFIPHKSVDSHFLFPNELEDPFLGNLVEHSKSINAKYFNPFVLK